MNDLTRRSMTDRMKGAAMLDVAALLGFLAYLVVGASVAMLTGVGGVLG